MDDWEENRVAERDAALKKGIVPVPYSAEDRGIDPLPDDAPPMAMMARKPWLMVSTVVARRMKFIGQFAAVFCKNSAAPLSISSPI